MEPATPPRHLRDPQPARGSDWFGLLSGLCMLLAILCMTQLSWQYYGAGLDTTLKAERQIGVTKTITREPDRDRIAVMNRTDPPPVETPPKHGALFAWMYLPDIDRAWSRPIWQGTSADVLDALGAGHYESTVMPGAQGNSAYAGHDTANDFALTYRLKAGDRILIRTSSHWYEYTVTETRTVTSTDTWVIADSAPGVDWGITLTTCWPMFTVTDTGQRWITWGRFTGWANTSDGVPDMLASTRMTPVEHLSRRISMVSHELDTPVTGVLAICMLAIWGLLAIAVRLIAGRCDHSRERLSWNPMVILWRLQPAPHGDGRGMRVFAWLTRTLLMMLLIAALVFACWRWACPWLAGFAGLSSPHPTL